MSRDSQAKSRTPRGIRNNNPLNIRIGNTWLGEDPTPTDSEFERFVAVQYGLRAGFCILRRYIRHYKRNTITKIINAWAPPIENNVESYIRIVAHRTGFDPDAELHFSDKESMCKLVSAMCVVECGQTVPHDTIAKAYDMS